VSVKDWETAGTQEPRVGIKQSVDVQDCNADTYIIYSRIMAPCPHRGHEKSSRLRCVRNAMQSMYGCTARD
jgi:hypothetical protein